MNNYEKQEVYRKKDRDNKKQWLDELRTVPCADCKGTFPPVCMDFDHLPGEVKLFGIMNQYARRGRPALIAEIAKCEVVCSNCHRIRTAARR